MEGKENLRGDRLSLFCLEKTKGVIDVGSFWKKEGSDIVGSRPSPENKTEQETENRIKNILIFSWVMTGSFVR